MCRDLFLSVLSVPDSLRRTILLIKNEVNRFGCTTRNRLDFDLAHTNVVHLKTPYEKGNNEGFEKKSLFIRKQYGITNIIEKTIDLTKMCPKRNVYSQGCSQKQLKKCQKHDSFRRFVPPKRKRDAMRCATAGRPNV